MSRLNSSNFIQSGLFIISGTSSNISNTLSMEGIFEFISLNLLIARFTGVYMEEMAPTIVIKSPGVKLCPLSTL